MNIMHIEFGLQKLTYIVETALNVHRSASMDTTLLSVISYRVKGKENVKLYLPEGEHEVCLCCLNPLVHACYLHTVHLKHLGWLNLNQFKSWRRFVSCCAKSTLYMYK